MPKRKVPDENQLIFLCARLEISDSNRQEIRRLLNSPINWHKIIAISNQQEILPFWYYNIKKLKLLGIIPQDTFAKIENCYYTNLKKNLRIEKEIILFLNLAERYGVSAVPLKGFSLIQTLYHNPGLRIMADVDILIKQNQFQKTKDILKQLNYHHGGVENSSQEPYQGYQYEITYSKIISPDEYVPIDLHCALFPPRPYRINLPCLWQRTQEKIINNQKLLFLSEEDTFLSLAIHLRRHTRRMILRFIVDIAELLNTKGDTFDWLYIKESARNNHAITSVWFSLYISKELLQATIPPKILNEFYPNTIKNALIHFTINKHNFFTLNKWRGTALRFLLFDKTIDVFLYLWRVSFIERFILRKNPNYNFK